MYIHNMCIHTCMHTYIHTPARMWPRCCKVFRSVAKRKQKPRPETHKLRTITNNKHIKPERISLERPRSAMVVGLHLSVNVAEPKSRRRDWYKFLRT